MSKRKGLSKEEKKDVVLNFLWETVRVGAQPRPAVSPTSWR